MLVVKRFDELDCKGETDNQEIYRVRQDSSSAFWNRSHVLCCNPLLDRIGAVSSYP
jgi:hypothetical protein